MQIHPIEIIKDMSGKICAHSDTYISLNSTSGKMFTGKRCNPYTGPATDKQLAQQQVFKQRVLKATAWLNANKPSETTGEKGSPAYQEAQKLKKQLQLSNVRQVICKYMDATGTVTLPTSGATTVPSGSGTSSSGGTGNTDPVISEGGDIG